MNYRDANDEELLMWEQMLQINQKLRQVDFDNFLGRYRNMVEQLKRQKIVNERRNKRRAG